MTPFNSDGLPNNLGQTLDAYDSPRFYGQILNKFLTDCTDIAISFFDARKDDVKMIYDAIRDNKYPYNKVLTCSVEDAMLKFSEYFKGLHEYAGNLVRLDSSYNISKDAIKKMVSEVEEKNSCFVESIIRGSRNPEKSVSISEAMINVENLKLVISSYMVYNEKAKPIFESLDGKDNSMYMEEITLGLRTYTTAISDFAYCCLTEVVNSYNNIMDSMKCRIPANGIKEIPKYKIF